MGLAAPLALLGLLAIAVPVIAHLLRRRDVPTRPLATIALLRRAEVASRRRVRVVDRVLLAARIALVVLAVLALCAPYVTSALAWGDGRVASVVVVIDDSMSMSRTDGSGVLLDRAIERARAVIDALPAGSEVAIVLAGEPPRVLAPRSEDAALALGRLDRVRAGAARGTALGPSIELAARQLAGARHPLRRVVVLTDHAAHADPGDPEVPRDLAIEIERLGDAGPSPNLAVTGAIATPDPTAPAGEPAIAIAIEVRAHGDARERADVVVRRGGAELARGEIALAEGRGRTVIRIAAAESGDPAAEVALDLDPPDALPLDDARGVLLRPASAPRVLILDGDPQPLGRQRPAAGDEARFLEHALSLAPRGAGGGGVVHRTVDPGAFLGARLEDVDVLVLANVDLGDASLRARVEQHVVRGGGLWVTAGDHVDASGWARLEAILPARLISTIDAETVGLERGAGHATLLEGGTTGLETVRAARRLALEAQPGADVVLAWPDGAPALLVARERRVAVLGTSVDDAWSDLPFRPGFLPLVVRLIRALAPPGAMPDAPFSPGGAPMLTAPDGATAMELIAPDGRVVEIDGAALRSADRAIDLSDAVEPGAWRVRVALAGGAGPDDAEALREAPRSAFVVAAPPGESDLAPPPEAAPGGAGAGPEIAAAPDRTIVRRSLSPFFFAAIGLLAILEGLLRIARPRAPLTAAR